MEFDGAWLPAVVAVSSDGVWGGDASFVTGGLRGGSMSRGEGGDVGEGGEIDSILEMGYTSVTSSTPSSK